MWVKPVLALLALGQGCGFVTDELFLLEEQLLNQEYLDKILYFYLFIFLSSFITITYMSSMCFGHIHPQLVLLFLHQPYFPFSR